AFTPDGDTLEGFETATITGGAGNNIINASGFSGPVKLDGGAGDDTLQGGSSSDTFTGGAGNDTLIGNNGNDTFVFDADSPLGSDVIQEFGDSDGGIDTLNFSATTDFAITISLATTAAQSINANLT